MTLNGRFERFNCDAMRTAIESFAELRKRTDAAHEIACIAEAEDALSDMRIGTEIISVPDDADWDSYNIVRVLSLLESAKSRLENNMVHEPQMEDAQEILRLCESISKCVRDATYYVTD